MKYSGQVKRKKARKEIRRNHATSTLFQLILEAIPKDETDQARRYRGYIAVDDLYFDSGDSCQGHCTFDSGMCGFLNDNSRDDFDWTVVSFL